MFDRAELHAVSRATALEGRAKYNEFSKHGDRDIYKGLTFFSPNINIFRDPRWGRGHETLGEDPYLTAELGKAFVNGMQGDGDVMIASACAKHYAVHSGPEAIRHHFNAIATQKDMWETYLPAFEALVKNADVESVMGAYNRVNGEPCCGSKTLLVDILRSKWGFAGFVVSDCWALIDFHTGHGVTSSPEESAALAMQNGCDINCGSIYLILKSAYDQGLVTEDQVTLAAERAFTTRYLLGIMGEGSEFDKIPYETVECKEHLALAQETALKSCVLLKNDGILPLKKAQLKTLSVIGPNADSRVALTGNYHGTSSRYITILEGIQDECADDVRVMYAPGCDLYRRKTEALAFENDRVAEAVTVAEHGDTVLLVLGLDETLEGEAPDDGNSMEAGDKPDLLLPDVQRELMERVLAVGKPTVVILLAGSSIDLSVAEERAQAVFCAWYPGDVLPRRRPRASAGVYGLFHAGSHLPLPRPHAALPLWLWLDLLGCARDSRLRRTIGRRRADCARERAEHGQRRHRGCRAALHSRRGFSVCNAQPDSLRLCACVSERGRIEGAFVLRRTGFVDGR